MEADRSTIAPIETVVDGPGTVDGFTTLANRWDVNKKGTTDEMDWSEMGQEEVQDQQNDADKLDIFLIDILSCYCKPNSGKLMLRITRWNGLGEDVL